MAELNVNESRANDEMDRILEDAKQATEAAKDADLKAEMQRRQDEQLKQMGFATLSEVDRRISELKDVVYVVKTEQDKLKELIARARAQGSVPIPPQDPQPKTDRQLVADVYGDVKGL